MAWKHWLSLGAAALTSAEPKTERRPKARLRLEPLEQRDPAAGVSATLAAGTLTVAGTAGNDHILIRAENGLLIVTDNTGVIGQFKSGSVTQINVNAGAGNDLVRITPDVKQKATIDGGTGKNTLQAGGGATTLISTGDFSKVAGGYGPNTFNVSGNQVLVIGGAGVNNVTVNSPDGAVQRLQIGDLSTVSTGTKVQVNNPRPTLPAFKEGTITKAEVDAILKRAAAATKSDDAIVAISDRAGACG